MEDLIRMVTEKTGISAEHARVAVDTVVQHLKKVLPAPVAAQVDQYIGQPVAAGNAPPAESHEGESAQGLSGMLGKAFG